MSESPEEPAALAVVATDLPLETPPAPLPTLDAAPGEGAALRSIVGFKLAGALFLHHVAVGASYVTLGAYVSENTGSHGSGMFAAGFVGLAYGAGPLGAMISPFFTGILADRVFPAERIMVVLNLLCAAAMYAAASATTQGGFYFALFAYYMFFHPSCSLAVSLALHHLARPERDFAAVRACGTAGWIVGGLIVGWAWPRITGNVIEDTDIPLRITAVASLATAAFCVFMPHTPPARRRAETTVPAGMSRSQLWDLVTNARFTALMTLSVAAHIPVLFFSAYSNVFMNWAGMAHAAAKMTLGQVMEVIVMLLMPAVLIRVRVKTAILLGLAIWLLRFVLLAAAAAPTAWGRDLMLYAAILLHGVAFTFVTISLQLDVDRCAGRQRRATAQGLFSVAVQGVGCYLGAVLAGAAGARWLPDASQGSVAGWQTFWMLPAGGMALVIVLAVVVLAREPDVVGKRISPKIAKIH